MLNIRDGSYSVQILCRVYAFLIPDVDKNMLFPSWQVKKSIAAVFLMDDLETNVQEKLKFIIYKYKEWNYGK